MLRTLAVTLLLAASACLANTGNWYAPPKVVKPAVVTTPAPLITITTRPAAATTLPAPAATTSPYYGESPAMAPYVAFAWHSPAATLQHVVGTVWYVAASNPATVAQQLKALPAGKRALFRWQSGELLLNPADTAPWIETGSAAEAAFEDRFLSALVADGATVDYLQLDTELCPNTWNVTAAQLAKIKADPRWPVLVAEYGIDPANLPIGTLYGTTPQFNLAMQGTEAWLMQAAFGAALGRHYSAQCSDFGDGDLPASRAAQAPDGNNCVQPIDPPVHGNRSAPVYYSTVGNIRNAGVDPAKPLTVLNWEISSERAYAQDSVDLPMPWVCGKSSTTSALKGSPYADELVYHLVLSGGCTNLNLFDPGDGSEPDPQGDCANLDADLATIAAQARNDPRPVPLTDAAVPYSSPVLISGATLASGNQQRLYRVTVASIQPYDQIVNVVLPGEAGRTSVTVPAGEAGAFVTH